MKQLDFCAINDEIAYRFRDQIDTLAANGITNIELRKIEGKKITAYSPQDIRKMRQYCEQKNIAVVALATDIGKRRCESENILQRYEEYLKVAEFFDVGIIRVFSDVAEKGEDSLRNKIFDKIISQAAKKNIVVALENEVNTDCDSPESCEALLRLFDTTYFRLLYDAGNFSLSGYDSDRAYDRLSPYIAHIHLKDIKQATHEYVLIGQGDLSVRQMLKKLIRDGFQGKVSLESHYQDFTCSRQQAFTRVCESLHDVLREITYKDTVMCDSSGRKEPTEQWMK